MVKDTARQIKVNGISISYEDAGKGEIPIIFIHGFPFDKTTWKAQLESLKDQYRVIAYDIRGFGHSSNNKEIPSIDLFASDLLGFMDALEIKRAVVCGLSMGGYILMNAVSRYPERFEAIILSDTQCIADSTELREKRYESIRRIEKEGLEGFAEDFVNAVFCKNSIENKKEVVEEVKKIILSTSPQTVTATLHALAQRRESCTILKRISIPALIICGKEDKVTPLSQAELLFNSISGAKMHTIADAGHLANIEQPDAFNDHIHNFIPGFLS